MALTFVLWFGRLFSSARPVASVPPSPEKPLQIEIEHLPDYRWRELGFQLPRRPDEEVWQR